jgi:uncharacterized protein YuzE
LKLDAIKLYYDPEGDYLEIVLRHAPDYFVDTELDQVDMEGNIIGISILKVSSLKGQPFEVSLAR